MKKGLTKIISPVPFLLLLITLAFFLYMGCNLEKRTTKKRILSVENNLLEAVSIKGMPQVKMNVLDRMDFYKVPGLSMAVIDDFQLEWIKSYGFKDISKREPLIPETLFQAGEIIQPIAALCSLSLLEQGRIGWEDNVNVHLRSWTLPESRFTEQEKVTLKQLLTHTAGLSDIHVLGYEQGESLPVLVDLLNGDPLSANQAVRSISKPGVRMNLEGSEYVVLQQLLEDLEGKPFPRISDETVFTPLGMTRSIFAQPLPADLKPEAAPGHLRGGNPVEGQWKNYPELAVSGLWTTAHDIALLLIELMEAAQERSRKIISSRLAHSFFTPQVFNHGFGWIIDDEGENLIVHQEGSTEGYHCYILCYPLKGQGAVLMTNSSNGTFLIEELLRSLALVYKWPHYHPDEKGLFRLDTSIYTQYIGKYEITPDYILTISYEDYYLIIQPTGQSPTNFYVENPTSFFSTSPYIQIRFIKDQEEQVTGLVLKQAGNEIKARKIE